MNRQELKSDILKLAFDLEIVYSDLNFKHHCYLRIVFDFVSKSKWNNIIKSPFLNNCSDECLFQVLALLNYYLLDKDIVLKHNKISLNYRNGKTKEMVIKK